MANLNVPALGAPLVTSEGSTLRYIETRVRAQFSNYISLNYEVMMIDLDVARLSKRLQFAQRFTVSYKVRGPNDVIST